MSHTPEERAWRALAGICSMATFVIEPFVMVALWRWFAVPLGAPALTWSSACGLNLIVAVCIFRYPGKRDSETQAQASLATLFAALIAFGIGWLVVRLAS